MSIIEKAAGKMGSGAASPGLGGGHSETARDASLIAAYGAVMILQLVVTRAG